MFSTTKITSRNINIWKEITFIVQRIALKIKICNKFSQQEYIERITNLCWTRLGQELLEALLHDDNFPNSSFYTGIRRVAICKPGKPGLTSFSETVALFFTQFISFRKMKVQDKQNSSSKLFCWTCFLHFSFKTSPRRKHTSGSAKASATCESGLTRKKLTGYAPGNGTAKSDFLIRQHSSTNLS